MPPRPPPRARGHFGPDASRPTSGTAPKPAPSWRPSSLALGARTILTSTTGVHYRFRIRARTFATAKGLRDLWSPFCLRRATPGLLKSTVSRQNVLRDVAGRRQRAPAPSCRMAGDSPGGPRADLRSRQGLTLDLTSSLTQNDPRPSWSDRSSERFRCECLACASVISSTKSSLPASQSTIDGVGRHTPLTNASSASFVRRSRALGW